MGWGDEIHIHDPGLWGSQYIFGGTKWAREASVFVRTAFGHTKKNCGDECTWPQL